MHQVQRTRSPLSKWAGTFLGLSTLSLSLGGGSCSPHDDAGDDNLFPPGTVVDSCPIGHTCTPNDDGSYTVDGAQGNSGSGGSGVATGGSTSATGGAVSSGGGVSTGGFPSSGGSDGTSGSGGGFNTGGSNSGGGDPNCTNVPPPNADWDATCAQWASETNECDQAWMVDNNYCNESCGRCTPSSGTGGNNSGSGGNNSGTGGNNQGGMTLPDINGGTSGWTTRYWDCCMPHCAWQGNGGTAPVCAANGTSQVGENAGSACSGGSGYMCYNQAPRAVSSTVSYGYAAVPNAQCGQCYHLQFTGTGRYNDNDPGSRAIQGKHMIVKVSNTGSDVHQGQFDLLIPGGGVGQFNACSNQWGVSNNDLGAQYGGFLSACNGGHDAQKQCVRQRCDSVLPAGELRDACHWFVDWFEVADNPNFVREPIACPAGL